MDRRRAAVNGQPIGLADPMIAAIALVRRPGAGHREYGPFPAGSKSLATASRWSTGDRKLNEDAPRIASSG